MADASDDSSSASTVVAAGGAAAAGLMALAYVLYRRGQRAADAAAAAEPATSMEEVVVETSAPAGDGKDEEAPVSSPLLSKEKSRSRAPSAPSPARRPRIPSSDLEIRRAFDADELRDAHDRRSRRGSCLTPGRSPEASPAPARTNAGPTTGPCRCARPAGRRATRRRSLRPA